MNPLVSEKKDNPPILIVDRTGIIGGSLAEKLSGDAQIVLVSEKQTNPDNIIFVPFTKKFPVIPDSIYSHIFVIDDGDLVTRESFSSFLKKAQKDKSILVIATHIKNQSLIHDNLLEYKGSRIIFFGDVIDKNITNDGRVSKVLNQAKVRGRIYIPGDGMEIIYPLFFEDLILGLLEAAFGTSADKVYYLIPKGGVTFLSFSHMIQKANPSIGIDFVKSKDPENIIIIREGKYLLPNYPLEDKVRNLNLEVLSFSKSFDNEKQEVNEDNHEQNKTLRTTFFFLILFIFMPLVSTLLLLLLGTVFINSAKISLGNGDFENANKSIVLAGSFLDQSKKTSSLLVWETAGFGFSKSLEALSIDGSKTAQGLGDFFEGVRLLDTGKTSQSVESFKNFLIFAQIQKANNKSLDFFDENLFNLASATVDVWPQLLGFDSKKNYLVLLENNLKIRPSGGLVESYGILTVNKGKVENFSIKNAYDSDKALKGRVEPPYPIRRYLGEANWFLKDSNFDVDFRQSASSSAFFVNLEAGEKIDGVIALNFNFIKNFLKSTGPVFISEYKKSIDSENLLSIAQEQSGDKNFSTILLGTIKAILENKKISYLLLAKSIGQSTLQKDILLASSDQNVENIFVANNLSDSLWDGRVDNQKNINDFVGIREANMNNLSNFLVTRKVSQAVEIKDDGGVSSVLTVEFKNDGKYDYKNYLRLILPDAIRVKTIKIDGVQKDLINAITDPLVYEASNFKSPSELELESYREQGKSILGFLITVGQGKSQTIEITYDLPQKPPLSSLSNFTYSLNVSKQPGTSSYPFNFSMISPKSFKVLSFPKGVSANEQNISFSKDLSGDLDLNLDFSQK